MGNRAFVSDRNMKLGVYLHWNGGRDSIEAFCEYCRIHEFEFGTGEMPLWVSRFSQVVMNMFGPGSTSVVVEPFEGSWTAGDDNGLYIIDNWRIVGRYREDWYNYKTGEHSEWPPYGEPDKDDWQLLMAPWDRGEQRTHDLNEFLHDLDRSQPEDMQLGDEYIDAPEVRPESLGVGDEVAFVGGIHGKVKRYRVERIDEDGNPLVYDKDWVVDSYRRLDEQAGLFRKMN